MHDAALDEGEIAEYVLKRLADASATVDDAQDPLADLEAALDQPMEQRGAQRCVLRRALLNTERNLAAGGPDAERNDERLTGDFDAVEHQRHHVDPIERAAEVIAEFLPR